jgi:tRNA(Ile)-lysidine synthase
LEAALASRDVDTASDGDALDAAVLRRWPPARQRAALRVWCQRSGVRVPDERRLAEALRMLEAREDATPLLEWPGARLRLHRGRLLLSRLDPSSRGAQQQGDEQPPTAAPEPWHWQHNPDLHIANTGTLSLHADPQGDLDLARLPATLWLHWPRSGAVRAAGQSQRALRKRLQSLAVPAWERDHLPLIFAGDPGPLIAIADLWLDPQFQAQPDSPHRGRLRWRPAC